MCRTTSFWVAHSSTFMVNIITGSFLSEIQDQYLKLAKKLKEWNMFLLITK